MNIFYILDPTTLIISLPQTLLWCLIFVAARQKKCYPWPTQHSITTIGSESEQHRIEFADALLTKADRNITTLDSVRSEFLTYFISVALGSGIFNWCSSHLLWPVYLPLTDLHALIPTFINMCITLAITLPILWFKQLRLFRVVTRNEAKSIICSSQFILCISILTVGITLTLPIVQLLSIGLGSSAQSAHVMRDVLRIFIALSAIPSSISGNAVAWSRVIVERRKLKTAEAFLSSNDFSTLDLKSVDELHHLINVALKLGKLETADQISIHLLRRVEDRTII